MAVAMSGLTYWHSGERKMNPCPFCNPDKSRVLTANDHALAIPDTFPIAPGHTLVIPKRHIASLFEATREEQTAMFDLLAEMRKRLLNSPSPPFAKAATLRVRLARLQLDVNKLATLGQRRVGLVV